MQVVASLDQTVVTLTFLVHMMFYSLSALLAAIQVVVLHLLLPSDPDSALLVVEVLLLLPFESGSNPLRRSRDPRRLFLWWSLCAVGSATDLLYQGYQRVLVHNICT